MTTLLPLTDHPIVREAAEGMARESILMCCEVDGEPPNANENSDAFATVAKVYARLLCSLDREASRDWWVRWGKAQANAYHDKRLTRTLADWWTPETWAVHVNADRTRDLQEWESDRDRPETLANAIHAALATLTPATR